MLASGMGSGKRGPPSIDVARSSICPSRVWRRTSPCEWSTLRGGSPLMGRTRPMAKVNPPLSRCVPRTCPELRLVLACLKAPRSPPKGSSPLPCVHGVAGLPWLPTGQGLDGESHSLRGWPMHRPWRIESPTLPRPRVACPSLRRGWVRR